MNAKNKYGCTPTLFGRLLGSQGDCEVSEKQVGVMDYPTIQKDSEQGEFFNNK